MILRKFGIYIPEYILSYPEDHSMNFHLGRKPDFHVYVYWRRQKKIDVRIWRRSLKPQQFRTATCHQCGLVGTGGAVTNSVLSSCLSKCFHDFHGRYAEARGSCQVCWKLFQVSSSARHYGTLCSNIHPTRCNVTQFIYIWKLLYMFRVVPPPIIRSAYNCLYSIWYLSHRYCYLALAAICSLLYLETVLHVSGGTSTHHQERIQLYLQHLVFVTPLLLSAASGR